jgi:hypothetical protein
LGLRVTRFLVLLALITLLGLQSVASQSSDWIDRTVVTQYVKNLLDTYNSLVNLNYGYYPDAHVLDRFRLYHAVGYSFNVTVMRFNSTTKAFVVFVFLPIMAASPLVLIDNNDTFIHIQFPNLPESLESAMSSLLRPNNTLGIIQVQGTSVGPNGTRLAPRIWIANATTMFANIMTSSADAANYIFKSDQAGYNQDLARTQTTASSQSASTPSAIIGWIGSIGITDVAWWIIGLLVLYFGGIRPVVALANPKERKKVVNELKALMRLFRLKRSRKTNEIKNENSDAEKNNQHHQISKMEKREKERDKTKKSQ